ncbi:transcriptional regulator, partial [Mycolicibacterium austroafricanum]
MAEEHRGSGLRQAINMLTGGGEPGDSQIRHAAWVARCVGRGVAAPLHPDDLAALAGTLNARQFDSGAMLFSQGQDPTGVWI